ncbi:hypothetical protein ACFOEW_11685 [Alteromonas oceani]|uniref:Uncharacterized protein n=2 Tax=Alteromonas TaxID=226 RepID=A0A2S9V756_9ALTE|nr:MULTISPECIES: hypothetical protein [Alteromonas]PRO72291.1 hypothetical protein C6Y40_17745 [Alteromonas alba]
MSISQFIEEKSRQLCFYLRAFWQGTLNYQELNYFFWDTLEEWSLYRSDDLEPSTHKERVFWHLLHQIHYWREDQLTDDEILREELTHCVAYLKGESVYPMDCIGIRP